MEELTSYDLQRLPFKMLNIIEDDNFIINMEGAEASGRNIKEELDDDYETDSYDTDVNDDTYVEVKEESFESNHDNSDHGRSSGYGRMPRMPYIPPAVRPMVKIEPESSDESEYEFMECTVSLREGVNKELLGEQGSDSDIIFPTEARSAIKRERGTPEDRNFVNVSPSKAMREFRKTSDVDRSASSSSRDSPLPPQAMVVIKDECRMPQTSGMSLEDRIRFHMGTSNARKHVGSERVSELRGLRDLGSHKHSTQSQSTSKNDSELPQGSSSTFGERVGPLSEVERAASQLRNAFNLSTQALPTAKDEGRLPPVSGLTFRERVGSQNQDERGTSELREVYIPSQSLSTARSECGSPQENNFSQRIGSLSEVERTANQLRDAYFSTPSVSTAKNDCGLPQASSFPFGQNIGSLSEVERAANQFREALLSSQALSTARTECGGSQGSSFPFGGSLGSLSEVERAAKQLRDAYFSAHALPTASGGPLLPPEHEIFDFEGFTGNSIFRESTSVFGQGTPPTRESTTSKDRERPHICEICSRRYVLRQGLLRHMKIHSRETSVMCPVCGKLFTENSALVTHMRSHTKEKPFTCEICQKSFTVKSSLDTHQVIHTKEKPFKCEVCEKAFSWRGGLDRHMNIHTKEKVFACDTCSKSFNDKSTLVSHIRTHTNERPFACELCFKAFARRRHLVRHLGVHARRQQLKMVE